MNLQGNILAINSTAEQITGESISMVGENLSIMNLFGAENIPRMLDYFERTVRGSAQHYVVSSSRKDGSVSHWSMKNIPIYVNSRIIGVFVVAREITSAVEVEHKLAQREAEYRLIINNMKDMMGVLDQKVISF